MRTRALSPPLSLSLCAESTVFLSLSIFRPRACLRRYKPTVPPSRCRVNNQSSLALQPHLTETPSLSRIMCSVPHSPRCPRRTDYVHIAFRNSVYRLVSSHRCGACVCACVCECSACSVPCTQRCSVCVPIMSCPPNARARTAINTFHFRRGNNANCGRRYAPGSGPGGVARTIHRIDCTISKMVLRFVGRAVS